jgi:hypothetical protein
MKVQTMVMRNELVGFMEENPPNRGIVLLPVSALHRVHVELSANYSTQSHMKHK